MAETIKSIGNDAFKARSRTPPALVIVRARLRRPKRVCGGLRARACGRIWKAGAYGRAVRRPPMHGPEGIQNAVLYRYILIYII